MGEPISLPLLPLNLKKINERERAREEGRESKALLMTPLAF
jgi:hypothetical protein